MLSLSRSSREAIKQLLSRSFRVGQRLGVDILPRHFYSEIPDIAALERTRHWREPYSMIGVSGAEIEPQMRFVENLCGAEHRQRQRDEDLHERACQRAAEVGFGPMEAVLLDAFIAGTRPNRIIQVGCGVSTAVVLGAAEHVCYQPEVVCIEPYPSEFLQSAAAQGLVTLVPEKVETIEPTLVESLKGGDLLFIDSTHTLGPQGEVSRLILEWLPRLCTGAWVHFHDIMFPYDYSRRLLDGELFFQHESALLHAFLTGNRRFEIAASMSMLHYSVPARLGRSLVRYDPQANSDGLQASDGHFPSSTYLRVG